MIVDLETRRWQRIDDLGDEVASAVRRQSAHRWLPPDGSQESHAAAMRAVDAYVLVGYRSRLLRGAIAKERTSDSEFDSEQGRKFLAIAIDPTDPRAADDVETARADGASMLWIDPALQGYHPADTRAMRVFDRAEAAQLPVLIGWSGPQPASARMEFARPYLFDEVARAFPRLSLVFSGLAGPFVAETLALLSKHDRAFATTAGIASRPWELLHALECARDHGVDRKLLFASGFPFDTPTRVIEAIYGINALVHGTPLPRIARSVLREIIERDSISVLGLGTAPAPRDRDANRSLATDGSLRLLGESTHASIPADERGS
jgi:hypothetical protein